MKTLCSVTEMGHESKNHVGSVYMRSLERTNLYTKSEGEGLKRKPPVWWLHSPQSLSVDGNRRQVHSDPEFAAGELHQVIGMVNLDVLFPKDIK